MPTIIAWSKAMSSAFLSMNPDKIIGGFRTFVAVSIYI